jgi:hypothetical protein
MTYQDQLPKRPGFGARFLIGILLIPVGIALRVLTQIYLEITQEAVHFWNVMGIVSFGHLVLICLTVIAVLNYRRRPWIVLTTVQLWIGYGIGTALLILKDMG